jgi:XTP/dITP diphosphohydrolase
MTKTLLIATGNEKKRKEMEALVSGIGWEIKTLRDFPDCPEAVEDGETFMENAHKKALHYAGITGLLTLADDSGLAVDALNGRPGVYSARYAHGEGSDDEANLQKVLRDITGVPAEQRTARFICAAALAQADGVVFETQQSVEGVLTEEKQGDAGFGYDPIFYYPPFGQTFAEVPAEAKHDVSHRGKALREVVSFLQAWR